MNQLVAIALSFSLLGGLTACGSSSKSEDPAPPTKAELLSDKDWLLTSATATVLGQPVDVYATVLQTCQKDDLLRYNSNNTYTISEGATSCTPPDTDNGTWSLSADGTKLTQTSARQGSTATTQDVLELTTTSLKISSTYTYSGIAVPATLTFTKK
ncbi:lipocalin family protein [Hymenobacter sp. BT491]|uniref:lipocalin family protein n=1 Tax=Hymenobacter sp. BT491 TaxID=2766779 RepID=UPI001653EBF8|nr:lipocalin family protein [Hymenobacter sp. BT491]MBC6991511.1 lipocalin family protein [Hymenobacter sp. BT491]